MRADPDFTAAQSLDAAALQQNAEEPSEDHPPEFKSAARQEHMDEAAAIRRHMQVSYATHVCACLAMQCMLVAFHTVLTEPSCRVNYLLSCLTRKRNAVIIQCKLWDHWYTSCMLSLFTCCPELWYFCHLLVQ